MAVFALQDYFIKRWKENLPDDDAEKYADWYVFRLMMYIASDRIYLYMKYNMDEVKKINEKAWETIENMVKYEAKDKMFQEIRYATFNNSSIIFAKNVVSNFGSANQMMGVRQTTDFLEKATWTMAAILVVLCLVSSIIIPKKSSQTYDTQMQIAKRAYAVVGVELDKNLIPILREHLADYDNVKIINNDILKTDINDIIQNVRKEGLPSTAKVRLIGNLPYYITTPIIMKLLENDIPCESISIMVQKEVGERLLAKPCSTDYGSITVAVSYRCELKKIADVPAEMFHPRPKVDSMVIMLIPRKEKSVKLLSENTFFAVVRGAFGKRRKTLLNSLTGVLGMDRETVAATLEKCGIDPVRCVETLALEEFAELANEIHLAV